MNVHISKLYDGHPDEVRQNENCIFSGRNAEFIIFGVAHATSKGERNFISTQKHNAIECYLHPFTKGQTW